MYSLPKIERFNQHVRSKFKIYNSLFLTLPFDEINNTGVLLPIFSEFCQKGLANKLTPIEIIDGFALKYLDNRSEKELINLMFRFIQYVERQIVLFDAIEDAAFPVVNNMEGKGTIRDIKERADTKELKQNLINFLEEFKVRTVLTAHPTQFYPGSVLGIITDLTQAIKENDIVIIEKLLAQLGKTPFIKKEKPTPFDEAVSLIWYLENVFYEASGEIINYIQKNIYKNQPIENSIINLGFWPGGDRDGNPFVTTDVTIKVAERLRTSIMKCYYTEIRKLKRKLTFPGVDNIISAIEYKLYRSVFYSQGEIYISLDELINDLTIVKELVTTHHNSLYLDEINSLLLKINLFGYHFASLDIRQNSKIHLVAFNEIITHLQHQKDAFFPDNFQELNNEEKIKLLSELNYSIVSHHFTSDEAKSTISSIRSMKEIQKTNGEAASNRYIISNCESALHVMEVYALLRMCDWNEPNVDVVPLFESVDDLIQAPKIMEQLYQNEQYVKHLSHRKHKQVVMLGFSDGTKDGGYLMANWSIFKAKERITEISRKYNIKVLFFDGRGGPPARGGGKTHKFYASLGSTIEHKEIQLTIQGQTISSNFGTIDSCKFNLENLLSAGIANELFNKNDNDLSNNDIQLINELAEIGYHKYLDFKSHPKFISYLENRSTLNYYSKTNIGSRPSKRNASEHLVFSDLRAIPFVGSWSQMKQNVPGFFGVGTALKTYEDNGKWEQVHNLYSKSLFFRTLLENSMMALAKSNFELTRYMQLDKEYGEFWNSIYAEYELTKRLLLKIAGHSELMENYPDGKASVSMREEIVLPLLMIQQYALMKINSIKKGSGVKDFLPVYEKLVTRSLFGNTNASRNSA